MKEAFIGEVIDGEFIPKDKELWSSFLRSLSGEVSVSIGKYRETRSERQNKYYWGKVIKMLSEELGYGKDEVHSLLSSKFLKDHVTVEEGGVKKRYTVVKSTASLDSEEMAIYIEECKSWASMEVGLFIPD
jgi:hypothetical protein